MKTKFCILIGLLLVSVPLLHAQKELKKPVIKSAAKPKPAQKTKKKSAPITYDYVGDFSEGLAHVQLNGKYGFVNKSGEVVIPIKYDYARDFSEGLAAVQLNGKWGFINKSGKIIIPSIYDDAGGFSDGYALVERGDKWLMIDKQGNEYDDVE